MIDIDKLIKIFQVISGDYIISPERFISKLIDKKDLRLRKGLGGIRK